MNDPKRSPWQPADLLRIETYGGAPISAAGWTLTPFIQAVRLQFPVFNLNWEWKRPVSVLAVQRDGQEQIVRIQDVTRQVLIGLAAVSLLNVLLMRLILSLVGRKLTRR